MMLAKVESGKKHGGGSGNGKLLKELEVLSKSLYLNKNLPNDKFSATEVRSKSAGKAHFPEQKPKRSFVKEDLSEKDKKSSIWDWKPWKALSHIRSRRFNCFFSLQVHAIEGLPPNFNDINVRVHWNRKDGALQTRPARVFQGVAEFEEILTYKCSVYVSGNGPHHSAKYEAKHFLLHASIVGVPDVDLGKHRVDLTRILPLTLEELEEEKSSGKWTTSFKLSGKAKGATMNVSFGFSAIGDVQVPSGSYRNHPENQKLTQNRISSMKLATADQVDNRGKVSLRRSGSLPDIANQRSHLPSQFMEDVKILHEILPSSKSELASSVSILYQKFDEGKIDLFVDCKREFEASSEHVEPLKAKLGSFFEPPKENNEKECKDTEFTVVEKSIEKPDKFSIEVEEEASEAVNVSAEETTEVPEVDENYEVTIDNDNKPHPQDVAYRCNQEVNVCDSKENNICSEESIMEELDSAFHSLSISESAGWDSPQCKWDFTELANYMEVKSNYKAEKVGKSLSLDDATESVAIEFLSMLGIEHSPFGMSSDSDPESPRERLLRQFEMDTLNSGNCIFGFDISEGEEAELCYDVSSGSRWGDLSQDFELSSAIQAAEAEHQIATQAINSKTKAKMLEDMETEALMREWGLNEGAFQSSPPDSAGGFGSPIDLPPEVPLELPPLGEGLGPYLQTKEGGFLRSMNPSLFKNAKNSGSLIMQVSSPIVVPVEMGSGITEILQCLASVGIEKLSMQANKLMPLEDITGKTMHQVAWEATPSLEAGERQAFLQNELEIEQNRFGGTKKGKGGPSGYRSNNLGSGALSTDRGSEYVSLEDLAPLAMDKIEALCVEGLRIQCGMSDEDAPSNICPQSIGEISALEGKKANNGGFLGLEGAAGLQLLDIKDGGDDIDGLMGLSITLDEWMRLDSGIVDEDQISERTSKILAAHHSKDLATGGWKGDKKQGNRSGRTCGLLENNFTVALMVQLRDPFRNYEPVGTPMLALVQVERVFVPPKPKIYSTVSENRINSEEDDESELMVKEEIKKDELNDKNDGEEGVPHFKITEVHVAGLKNDPNKRKLWGSKTQQQSGSRWLVASGMGKSNKHPFFKSKEVAKSPPPKVTTTVQPGDTLWSISSRVHGTGAKWKELAALNPHIRNPNVIFPNETIRLR
ncbi:protein PLASTID MOVEMENT IMPAIRED 1-RELATED 1-like [Telopea speciosissima]|uniref:protein PLASTID MOVEMENT IMPAIRED 1-RELATED 1-like n=1 Tax=Telopea speciosissima TaxID=54955 RepID=UPI001CC741CF|nr:protein PLASTID MOVEMENT IMPAIRED 1-RELATED 1-like [Telopea speciosissima]